MSGQTCRTCGMALFSDGAVYGPIGCLLCLSCWFDTVDLMQRAETLDRVDRPEQYAAVVAELARRLPKRHGVGPMLPLPATGGEGR